MRSRYSPDVHGSSLLTLFSGQASLRSRLIAYWAGENANDSHTGGYNLTAYNTPTYTSGLVANAFTLVSASTQYLDITSVDALAPLGDFEIFCWANFTTVGADRMLINNGDANAVNYPHSMAYELMYVHSGTKFRFTVGNNTTSIVLSSTAAAPSAGSWYAVNAYHQAGVRVGISINNGAFDTSAYTGGSYRPVALPLTIGKWSNFNGARMNGLIDEVGFWGRLLSTTERQWLYNSGAGRAYSSLT